VPLEEHEAETASLRKALAQAREEKATTFPGGKVAQLESLIERLRRDIGDLKARLGAEQRRNGYESGTGRWGGHDWEFSQPRPIKDPDIPDDVWKRLAHLCHPDKNDNSNESNEVMKWLLANRPSKGKGK
jgi:hypothetical protein